jgi:hypothetical protein
MQSASKGQQRATEAELEVAPGDSGAWPETMPAAEKLSTKPLLPDVLVLVTLVAQIAEEARNVLQHAEGQHEEWRESVSYDLTP